MRRWLADTLEPARGLSLGLADSASVMGFAIGAGGFLAVFAPRFRTVAAVCLGLAALLAAGTGSLPAPQEIASGGWPLAVHVVLAMGSAGMFAIAAVLVVLLALQDAALRGGRTGGWLATLPPVESLERALFSVIGSAWRRSRSQSSRDFSSSPTCSPSTLCTRPCLPSPPGRYSPACWWAGGASAGAGARRPRYTIAGFVVLAVAYFGSKFVLEILLGRHWG